MRAAAGPVLAAVLLASAVTGCGPETAGEPHAHDTAGPSSAPAPDPAGPARRDTAGDHGHVPGQAEAALPTPATTSGPLDAADLPRPERLGEGWTAYRDPGGAERGFAGNGHWVRAREPAGVVDALVPLGCAGAGSIPRPSEPAHALEGTFRGPAGEPAVALALGYAEGSAAATAFRSLARMYAACADPGRDETVIATRRSHPGVLWQERRFAGAQGDVWREVLVREGETVALVAVLASEAAPDFAALERALRSGVGAGATG